MPLRASDLMNETAFVNVKTNLGEFRIQYRPHALTPAREQEFALAIEENDLHANPVLDMLEDILVSWEIEGPLIAKDNVYDEDDNLVVEAGTVVVPEGEPVLPKRDHMMHLSSKLLGSVIRATQQEAEVDPKPGKRSGGGSLRRVR